MWDEDTEAVDRLLDRMLSQYLPLKVADAVMEVVREAAPGNDMRLEVAVQRLGALVSEEAHS